MGGVGANEKWQEFVELGLETDPFVFRWRN